MKLIVLTENTTADAAIGCEHGLSLYIETGGKRILFDMGQTALFAENAQKLCVDLARIDFAVLSHGHYDHGGGLQTFLTCNKTAPVFLSRYAFEPHYNGTEKYIGLDTAL
ncbi:MAG: MBL fold metallo-hydrolase, partial [Ruminococcus sp.]|nr:MBL fold metallo-hydrolase [Ruminococcus sp.]